MAMANYREKIQKYEVRVKKAVELGLEPREKDIEKLYYYVSRAKKKGLDHKTKFKDDFHWAKKDVVKAAGELLELTAKVLSEVNTAVLESEPDQEEGKK